MRRGFVLLRKAAIVIVAGASVSGAVGLIWILVTEDDLSSLSTLQLVGMLALFFLPGATFAAWQLDRRAAYNRIPSDSDNLFETPEGIDFSDEPESQKPIARETPRAAIPGRASSDSDQPASHRRRKHSARHQAERD